MTWVAVLAGGFAVSCEEPRELEADGGAAAAPPGPSQVEPRRATRVAPETFEQIELYYTLRERVLELEIEIAEFQKRHEEVGFMSFLDLDPWQLGVDQIFFLRHFCERGEFTLIPEARVMLLERELQRRRWSLGLPGVDEETNEEGRDLLDRLDQTIARFEQRIADLEKVAALFRERTDETITYPTEVSADQLEAERQAVVRLQDDIRSQLAEYGERIAALRSAIEELPLP